mmetsp:Transcript_15123/g.12843  ORF Transcript_15123/g.12843 Transcript_15123/m.12843 type:complete len:155 (+) Transcript_15123:494-958(+)
MFYQSICFLVTLLATAQASSAYWMVYGPIVHALVLLMLYKAEKSKRDLFRKYIESKDENKKFKDLLVNYIPQSVVVFDKEAKILFKNANFRDEFEDFQPENIILDQHNDESEDKNQPDTIAQEENLMTCIKLYLQDNDLKKFESVFLLKDPNST